MNKLHIFWIIAFITLFLASTHRAFLVPDYPNKAHPIL